MRQFVSTWISWTSLESVRFCWTTWFDITSSLTAKKKTPPQDFEYQPEGGQPAQEEHQPVPRPGHFQTEEEDLRRVDQVHCGEWGKTIICWNHSAVKPSKFASVGSRIFEGASPIWKTGVSLQRQTRRLHKVSFSHFFSFFSFYLLHLDIDKRLQEPKLPGNAEARHR